MNTIKAIDDLSGTVLDCYIKNTSENANRCFSYYPCECIKMKVMIYE